MNPRLHAFLDRFGATGSLICAVHCALLPLVLAAIPSLGLSEWLGDGFELAFVVFATSVGVFSLVYGYRRHRRIRALGVLLAGLALLWAGLLFSPWHHGSVALHAAVMTLGGTLIGVAHLLNLRHRSEEHTSELQSLMRISYAVFCLKNKQRC